MSWSRWVPVFFCSAVVSTSEQSPHRLTYCPDLLWLPVATLKTGVQSSPDRLLTCVSAWPSSPTVNHSTCFTVYFLGSSTHVHLDTGLSCEITAAPHALWFFKLHLPHSLLCHPQSLDHLAQCCSDISPSVALTLIVAPQTTTPLLSPSLLFAAPKHSSLVCKSSTAPLLVSAFGSTLTLWPTPP